MYFHVCDVSHTFCTITCTGVTLHEISYGKYNSAGFSDYIQYIQNVLHVIVSRFSRKAEGRFTYLKQENNMGTPCYFIVCFCVMYAFI